AGRRALLTAPPAALLVALLIALPLNGLPEPFNPGEASGSKEDSGRGADNPAMFRVVNEANGVRMSRVVTPA
ncbi:hypothetical protein, partial [Deinococcus sp. 6YEL10]|uniref:hypothetical protein n=1 Tax=Deinococcus sp. 6YEL10 TaxID=2745870 RepID=UPI001E441619